ncbi:MAG: HigA family addiction module antidote protein [Candidatus Delongbacteria bacterium]|nr:HigA family addiction module antidote protein [Candidatus Delongbacteria bacterium]MCG2760505.1 HigA family addiction module antitoxin [Candidatus Delongbacteria bacterium]
MANKIINEYIPESVTHPGETLNDILEERGMSQLELAVRTGRPKTKLNEIIKGKISITPETAIQLENVLGIPADFWNTRQKKYDENIAKKEAAVRMAEYTEWLKSMPVNEMIKLGWLKKFEDKALQTWELLKFFGINSPTEWKNIWGCKEIAFRQSFCFKKNPEATSVWLRKGELEAQSIKCSSFDKQKFGSVLRSILPMTNESPEKFESEVIKLCAAAGVAVAFVPPLKGVPVYGITRWLNPDKALLQLSLRGKYEDIFWFTFFHEAGHILLHGKKDIFIESSENKDEKETEADVFARDCPIPFENWQNFIQSGNYNTKKAVTDFAEKLGISPAIVVGRLQHEKFIEFSHLNDMKRKFDFVE